MAKKGFEGSSVPAVLQQVCARSGWALCVGAGTSVPAFPRWGDLVQRLLAEDVGSANAVSLAKSLSQSFGPDALLQAAQDRLDCKDEKFAKMLSTALYADIKDKLGKGSWAETVRVLNAHHHGQLRPDQWDSFLRTIRSHYPSLTAISIAQVLASAIDVDKGPSTVLSFNAEPLLYALLNGCISSLQSANSKRRGTPLVRKAVTDRVTRATADRVAGRMPFVFCHGLLPIETSAHVGPLDASVDKLVFSESDYLQLANTSFSWQSSVFMDTCISRSVVFIGLSFSDPNIRRWLAWIHRNRVVELKGVFKSEEDSARHYWLAKRPSSLDEQKWTESVVAHLGVRLVWLEEWSDVGKVLRAMLGLTPS